MSSEDNSLTQFLDDYFAECEEHLGSIHRHLLVMDGFVNRGRVDPEVVDELLRALHSLKGLSAMVGICEAEQVAHAMEGALRKLKQAGTVPTESTMEALAGGTSVIEQVIAARRDQKPVPDIGVVLSRITPDERTRAKREAERPKPQVMQARGERERDSAKPQATGAAIKTEAPPSRLWRFQFSPSVELSARGVNVNTIRSHLHEIGRVLNATPHIVGGGQITFDFIVESDVDESRFSDWQLDGLTIGPYSPTTDVLPETLDVDEIDRKSVV